MMDNMETFTNRREFAELIRFLRGGTSFDAVDRQGGPSNKYQSQIEACEDAMPITRETVNKYCTAFDPDETGLASFLRALAEAFSAEEAADPERPMVRPFKSLTADGFYVGRRVAGATAIPAGGLIPPAASYARAYVDRAAGDYSVLRAAQIIVQRHNCVLLVPRSSRSLGPFLSGAARRIGSWSSVAHIPRARFDPLHGVYRFERALFRADALGATGIDRTRLAWAILVANADGLQWGRSPMESWIAAESGIAAPRWARHLEAVSAGFEGAPVQIDEVLATARNYLLPWSEQWFVGLKFRRGEPDDAAPAVVTVTAPDADAVTNLAWLRGAGMTAVEDRDLMHAADGEIWPFDDHAMPALPDVIADRGFKVLTLTSVPGGQQLAAVCADGPTYQWCPTAYPGNYGVITSDGVKWEAIQAF